MRAGQHCEHAFHIVAGAHGTVVRDSTLRDFNAAIKGNGDLVGSARVYPSDVLILNNRIYNRRARDTGNPVTAIDVVGGDRWTLRGNYIADIGGVSPSKVSYQAFLKGNGSGGLIERNLVVCSKRHTSGVRLGLSLGGGTTGAGLCQQGSCATEHRGGTIRNNLVMNCNDAGIYLSKSPDSRVYNNTVYNAAFGIDVRFNSTATVTNNLLSGPDPQPRRRPLDGDGDAEQRRRRRRLPPGSWTRPGATSPCAMGRRSSAPASRSQGSPMTCAASAAMSAGWISARWSTAPAAPAPSRSGSATRRHEPLRDGNPMLQSGSANADLT